MKTIAALSLALLAPAALAQNVLVVAQDGSGDFKEVVWAVEAASEGDVILVSPGNYSGVTVDGISVTIVADAPGISIHGALEIKNLAADQRVVVHGLGFGGSFFPIFRINSVTDCEGQVWIEDCILGPQEGFDPIWTTEALRITNANAVLARTSVIPGTSETGAFVGMVAEDATVSFYDVDIAGASGGPGEDGHRAIVLEGESTLFASGSLIFGGPGGFGSGSPCGDGGAGAAAIDLSPQSQVLLLDTEVHGGAGGSATGVICSDGPEGPQFQGGANITWLPGAARHFDVDSPIRSGELGTHVFGGEPGDVVLQVVAIAPTWSYQPTLFGPLLISDPFLVFLPWGVIPASGELTVEFPVSLPASLGLLQFFDQTAFVTPDGIRASPPSAPVLVPAGV